MRRYPSPARRRGSGDHDGSRRYRPDPARLLLTAFGVQVVFNQLNVVTGEAVNRLIDGVDRAVAVRRLDLDLFTTGQLHGSGGDIAGAGLRAEVIRRKCSGSSCCLLINASASGHSRTRPFDRQLRRRVVQVVHML